MEQKTHSELINKLDAFIRKYYKNQLIKGGLYSVGLLLAFFLLVTTLEYFGRFGQLARGVMFYSFLGTAGWVLWSFIVNPLLKLNRLGNVISHEQAAEIIGTHFTGVKDKLLNTLQLQELSETSPNDGLLLASIDQKTVELRPVPFTSAVNFSENKKYLKYAIPPLLLLLGVVLMAPGVIKDGTKRLVNHTQQFEEEAPFSFVVQNEKLEGLQQEDFELQLKIEGEEIPDEVFIEIDNNRFKLKKENTVSFKHVFKNLQATTPFRFVANEFNSKEYSLRAIPKPVILNFEVELNYPAYTGKKDEKLKNTGDMVVPAGTKVQWKFNTKNTEQVKVGFADSTYKLTQTGADYYTLSKQFLSSKPYSVSTQNQFVAGQDSVSYVVNVIPDNYPEIQVNERADSLSTKRIYFRGNVKDDYGFSKLVFHYRFTNKKDVPEASGEQKTEPILISKKTTQEQFFHFWDLAKMDIQAGDEIEYYFEVWDNDGVHGSKSARSQRKVFKAPSMDELAEKEDESNKQIKNDLEESIKEAKDIQKDIEKMHRKMFEKKQLGWQDKKQIQDLINKQKELQNKVQNLQQENMKKNNEQKEYKQFTEEMLEKQKQIEKLFDEILSDEMKEKMAELEKLMEELDKEEIQEMLENMELDNKDIEKELDRTLEVFKQMEFEQKLEEAIEKIDELKEKQEELAKESEDKKTDAAELEKKQEELNKEFEKLEKDMEELKKKNEELEFPNEMPDTKEEQEKAEQKMQESKQELGENKKKKASESQKGAADEMQKMSEKMQAMQSGMQSEKQAEDMEALRRLLENLVQLSFDQEDLMEELKQTDRKDPRYVKIAQEQRKLKDDAKMIEDSLFALSKRVPQLQAVVNREINLINQNMGKTIDYLSDRQTPQAGSAQQYIMTSVNNLALMLDEVVQQMQQQQSQQKFGNSSCNKPGSSSQPKPSSQSMKQMQEALNKQIEQMKKEMEKGKQKDGKKEGGKGKGQQMSMQLAKMAAQQEAIRNEIQRMTEEMGKGKDGKKEGDNQGSGSQRLKEIAKKMEETETDLVNKQITQETLRRQQDIMTRLLEHEKAERQRELDNKRESNEAQNADLTNPSEFKEYEKMKQQEVELLRTVPPSLSPFYKNKVNEYFNSF